jgi:hypothetical protein
MKRRLSIHCLLGYESVSIDTVHLARAREIVPGKWGQGNLIGIHAPHKEAGHRADFVTWDRPGRSEFTGNRNHEC